MKHTTIRSPIHIQTELPLDETRRKTISSFRRTIRNIFDHTDRRFLMVVGPCSFHDPIACLEYACKLKRLANEVSDTMFIVMRVYVEKPRTAVGWKGYLSDPFLDESYQIEEGIRSARETMLEISTLGLPISSELLNPMSYLYFNDLISWGAIGARTTESQPHREIASQLDVPVGIKNSTSGNIETAINSIFCVAQPQIFMGMNDEGQIAVIHSQGNPYGHLVLRGGHQGVNYKSEHVAHAEKTLAKFNLPQNIIIDCSHGNAENNYLNQATVLNHVIEQKCQGNQSIAGVILESFIKSGNQDIPTDLSLLQYGCSITDNCLGWEETEALIRHAHQRLSNHAQAKLSLSERRETC